MADEKAEGAAAEPAEAPKIDATFRNGSLTAVGIVLGFSLSFVNAWVSSPLPWSRTDVLVIVPLVAGIMLQAFAMARLLSPDSLVLANYTRARIAFLAGLMAMAAGIAIALTLDVLGYGQRNLLR